VPPRHGLGSTNATEPAAAVVGGQQVRLRLLGHRVTCVVRPADERDVRAPVTEGVGNVPMLPVTVVGPVLLMPDPARTAKLLAVPRSTVVTAALALSESPSRLAEARATMAEPLRASRRLRRESGCVRHDDAHRQSMGRPATSTAGGCVTPQMPSGGSLVRWGYHAELLH